jgi:hypothetical protein
MKKIILLLGLVPFLVTAQNKTEIREFTGRVVAFEPAWHFAYECIRMDLGDREEHFLFWPNHGKYLMDRVKVGDQATVRVEVNVIWQKRRKEMEGDPRMKGLLHRFRWDRITDIQIDGGWVSLSYSTTVPNKDPDVRVFLEERIIQVYPNDDDRQVFVFKNGLVGNYSFMSGVDPSYRAPEKGNVVSFLGHGDMPRLSESAVYPIAGVRQVYLFSPLEKRRGQVKSLLYKQNSACIGMVMTSGNSEVRISFPSDFAKPVREFLKRNGEVDFYYIPFKVENQPNPFELHALVAGADTLRIERPMYYGGEDVEHDHRPVEVFGRITSVSRSPHLKIMSIMVGNDAYVDIDAGSAQQLDKLLRRGVQVTVQGNERIRKDGEIYLKEYRIITPRKMVIDGKEFILN